ncbi:MAG: anaerobic ribonucleoside-triphosphate reductase [Elusimicrobia bacterium]|nr:anaerobic ribonucleoside-triphosphate reductase [Elusimicrobiota bacterium]
MEIVNFINTCVEKGYDWSEGEHEGKPGYFVGCQWLDTVAHFTQKAIESNEWAMLDKQVTQGKNVEHITRIVGYFSRIENWNKSKLGELRDRHNGDYRIEK